MATRQGGKSSRVKEVKVPWITVLDEEECNHVDDIDNIVLMEMLMEGGSGFEKGEALTLDDGRKTQRVVMEGTKRCRRNGQRRQDLRVLCPLSYYRDFKEGDECHGKYVIQTHTQGSE
jgi:hypothetical protein